jgi:methylase of polypeptide subunit release factors
MSFAAPAKWMPYFLMRVYSSVFGALRSNRTVFHALFGFTPLHDIEGSLWDWTTLELRKALRRCLRPGYRLLDMGSGPVAVLGIYARNILRHEKICAVDHIPEIVSFARRSAELAHADIDVYESSLFESVTGQYEVIAFNAPYIDATSGKRLGLLDSETARKRCCGGKDGLETIDRFLAAAAVFLSTGGLVLLGINHFYVPRNAIEDLAVRYRWSIAWVIRNRWTHAAVYALHRPVESDEIKGSASGKSKG